MSAEQKPIRVLLIAYQCEPDSGSVSMIGWRWYHYLKQDQRVSVHLVTHVRHKARLEQEIPADEVSYIDTEWFAAPFYKITSKIFNRSQQVLFMVSNLDFLLFGHAVRRLCRKLKARDSFDIVHVPTPVAPVAPHRFGKIGPPTLVGPLNGGMVSPKGFPEILGAERGWILKLRPLLGLATRIWGTYRHSDIIFSATKANDRELGERHKAKIRWMCENAVDHVEGEVAPFPSGDRLELLFVGRILALKGLGMVFDALARLDSPNLCLTIVGDGPEWPHLRERMAQLKIEHLISFKGYQSQDALPGFFKKCHFNILPFHSRIRRGHHP